MDRIKTFLKTTRNAFAAIFAWLVICEIIVALLNGSADISVSFLIKTLLLSAWAAAGFALCFGDNKIRKKGFLFSMTCFYIVFIPVEVLMFYYMGIFANGGSRGLWICFGIIVVASYLLSVLIDLIVMRKKAELYTTKLEEYKQSAE